MQSFIDSYAEVGERAELLHSHAIRWQAALEALIGHCSFPDPPPLGERDRRAALCGAYVTAEDLAEIAVRNLGFQDRAQERLEWQHSLEMMPPSFPGNLLIACGLLEPP